MVLPAGPGQKKALDTLAGIECYCPEPHTVVVVDDCTQDGTYKAPCAKRRPAMSDAACYTSLNPLVMLFGAYARDYDRPRSFAMHERQIEKELSWPRKLVGLTPSWAELLIRAEKNGYRRGDGVFGRAYFFTRDCLAAINRIGVRFRWNSRLMEDVSSCCGWN